MQSTRYTVLAVTATVILVIAVLIGATTRPGIMTPVTERLVGWVTGHETSIGAAWLTWEDGPVYAIREIDVADRLQAGSIDLRPNWFGFLPGIAMVGSATAASGTVIIDRTGGGSMSTDYESYIDEVSLSGIDVIIRRAYATSRFRIVEGSGSLRGGTLSLDAVAGDGRVYFRGDGKLARVETIAGDATVEGPNLATVAEALGIAAPDVPPFTLNGRLSVNADNWDLTGISGEIGDSDIGGALTVHFREPRPLIEADLSSETLDFDDLGVIIGLPSVNEDGAALNEAQETANARYQQSTRFIPDASIDFSRLSIVDADVRYTAASVVDAPFTISAFNLDLAIENSLLTIEEFTASMVDGQMSLSGTVNGREQPAESDLSGRFDDLDLESIVPDRMARGKLQGRLDLALAGSDFRTAFGNADGSVSFWAEGARLAAVPIEAAGLDIGEALVTLAGQDRDDPVYVEAPCLVASLDISDGIGTADPIVADTEDSVIIVDGTVNLRNETLDLAVKADAKDFSWGTLMGDITVGGSWRDPSITVDAGGGAAQVLFAGLLGAVAGPLAALPFFETGDGKDVPCRSLLDRARSGNALPGGQ
ncbi:AsmA family protein [Aquisalinus flavus]|nr:AsmA family protein [Aquisalinus flavus]MBD0427139.1 AsmA family protein [Aquisalinus flavus]UNE46959.1 AsmA family protein [Aquisalinus flavus]